MTTRGARPLARVSLSAARAAYIGPALKLAPHRNAVATIALSLTTPFALRLSPSGAMVAHTSALIPPNTLHQLDATGPLVFLYLDALCDDYQRVRELDLTALRARLLRLEARIERASVDELCAVIGIPRRRCDDPRIAALVRQLDAEPQEFARVRDAALRANLSPSHFQALFAACVGMPFRRYRAWRRMAWVARALAAGQSLTRAAHEAGFASSAHLSTTFREMFGMTPSTLLKLGVRIDLDDDALAQPA